MDELREKRAVELHERQAREKERREAALKVSLKLTHFINNLGTNEPRIIRVKTASSNGKRKEASRTSYTRER